MAFPSITDALDRHAEERPQALAVVDGAWSLTWSELRFEVATAVEQLAQQGVRAGERVALLASDGIPAYLAALAVLRLGGVHVPIDHGLAPDEVQAVISGLAVPWRLTPGATLEQWRLSRTTHYTLQVAQDPLGAGHSAFIRYSSGTTGAAKGVLLSHQTLHERIIAANAGLALGTHDRVLWLLPMAYHFAVSILLYLHHGAALVFGNSLRASSSAAIARAQEVTFAYGSPYHVRRFAALPAGEDLPRSLRCMVSTTTALDSTAAKAFLRRHQIPVRQALGIIEVGLPLLSPGSADELPGELGVPLPSFEVRILSAAGIPQPPGESGELALRGPGMLDAYVAPWKARPQVLEDGFFRTGDIASCAPDGAVRLLGRLKDVINVGGVKVFPLEVEAVLNAHPDVVSSRVRGIAEARLGEQVQAEVQLVPQGDAARVVPLLHAWCGERLAALKRPAVITVVEALPMTGSGKVKR